MEGEFSCDAKRRLSWARVVGLHLGVPDRLTALESRLHSRPSRDLSVRGWKEEKKGDEADRITCSPRPNPNATRRGNKKVHLKNPKESTEDRERTSRSSNMFSCGFCRSSKASCEQRTGNVGAWVRCDVRGRRRKKKEHVRLPLALHLSVNSFNYCT